MKRNWEEERRLTSNFQDTKKPDDKHFHNICGWVLDLKAREGKKKDGGKFEKQEVLVVLDNVTQVIESIKGKKDDQFTYLIKSGQELKMPQIFTNQLVKDTSEGITMINGKSVSLSMSPLKKTICMGQHVKILGLRMGGSENTEGFINYYCNAEGLQIQDSTSIKDGPKPLTLPTGINNLMATEFQHLARAVYQQNKRVSMTKTLQAKFAFDTVYIPYENICWENAKSTEDLKSEVPNLATIMNFYHASREDFMDRLAKGTLQNKQDDYPTLVMTKLNIFPTKEPKKPLRFMQGKITMPYQNEDGSEDTAIVMTKCFVNGIGAVNGTQYLSYIRDLSKFKSFTQACQSDLVVGLVRDKIECEPSQTPKGLKYEMFTTCQPIPNFIGLINAISITNSKDFWPLMAQMQNNLRIYTLGGRLDQEGLISLDPTKKDVDLLLIEGHVDEYELNPLNLAPVKHVINLEEVNYNPTATIGRSESKVCFMPCPKGDYTYSTIDDYLCPLIGDKCLLDIIEDRRWKQVSKDIHEYQGDLLYAYWYLTQLGDNPKEFYMKTHDKRKKEHMLILEKYFNERCQKLGREAMAPNFAERSSMFKSLLFIPFCYKDEKSQQLDVGDFMEVVQKEENPVITERPISMDSIPVMEEGDFQQPSQEITSEKVKKRSKKTH